MNVRHSLLPRSSPRLAVMAVGARPVRLAAARPTPLPYGFRSTRGPAGRRSLPQLTAQFKSANPGWDVDVQYQEWNTHLGKFDATLAGGNAPDVIEMGNTEMTKYMAAGAFQDLTADKSSFPNSSTWLAGLAASGRFGGKLYGVPYYAGSRLVTYRTDLFRQAGVNKPPTSLAEFTAAAKKLGAKNDEKTFSPVYIAGTDWYVAMSFVYDHGGKIAITNKGKWIGTLDRPKAIAGLTAFKRFFDAGFTGVEDDDRDEAEPVRRLRPGERGVDDRARLVQLLRRRPQGRDGAVRDAEPHQGSADARLPRRLRPGRPGRCRQGAGRFVDPRLHRQRVDDRVCGRRATSRTRRACSDRASTSERLAEAGSSRPRSTGSTWRMGTSSARCWRGSSPTR